MAAETESPSSVGDGIVVGTQWTYAGDVSDHFDDHVARSVPFYHKGHELVAQLSDFFVHPCGVVYDIGCSTGALAAGLAARHPRGHVVAIDLEPRMAAKARQRCAGVCNVEVVEADATRVEFERSDLVVLYYTLQFIRPGERQPLIDALHASLNDGGALVMFEKVRASDAGLQDLMQQLYWEFKLTNGFSAHEIISKSRSLKSVLEPFTSEANAQLLRRAGFQSVTTIQKYVCFEGMLAIK